MSMFSAIAEIVAVVKVVDNATSPLHRVGNAAKATGGIIRALGDAAIGMAGAKGLYDWTVGAAQQYQMMQIGLGTIIQMHSKLPAALSAGMSTGQQAMEKYTMGLQIGEEMLDKLQTKALSGVGTFQQYAEMYQILAPNLIAGLGKNAFTDKGEEFMANYVNMAQHFKAIMMSAYGNGEKANRMTANELNMLMNHGARANEPIMRSLMPDWLGKIKEFNQMPFEKKFNIINSRLNEFAIASGDISKTWAAISTSMIDVVQMVGRGIGQPIMKELTHLALAIPGMKNLLGIRTDAEKSGKAPDTAMQRQQKVADGIKNVGHQIAYGIIAPFIILRDNVIPFVVSHFATIKAVAQDILITFLSMKAAAIATRGAKGALGIANAAANAPVLGRMLAPLTMGLPALFGRAMGPLSAVMARVGVQSSPVVRVLTMVGQVLMRIVGVGVGIGLVIIAVTAVITIFMMLKNNLWGLRDVIWNALVVTFNHLKAAMMALWPIIKVLIGICILLGIILAVALVGAFLLVMAVVNFGAQVITKFAGGLKAFFDFLVRFAQQMVNTFIQIVNGIADAINWLGGQINELLAAVGLGPIGSGKVNHMGPINVASALQGLETGAMGAVKGMYESGKAAVMNGVKGYQDAMKKAQTETTDKKSKYPPGGVPLEGAPREGDDGKGKGKHKPKGRQHHPHTTNVFQRGAINIEIKNMNNYPPDRIAYDMKKALLDKVQYKTTNTNGGIGAHSATFGGY